MPLGRQIVTLPALGSLDGSLDARMLRDSKYNYLKNLLPDVEIGAFYPTPGPSTLLSAPGGTWENIYGVYPAPGGGLLVLARKTNEYPGIYYYDGSTFTLRGRLGPASYKNLLTDKKFPNSRFFQAVAANGAIIALNSQATAITFEGTSGVFGTLERWKNNQRTHNVLLQTAVYYPVLLAEQGGSYIFLARADSGSAPYTLSGEWRLASNLSVFTSIPTLATNVYRHDACAYYTVFNGVLKEAIYIAMARSNSISVVAYNRGTLLASATISSLVNPYAISINTFYSPGMSAVIVVVAYVEITEPYTVKWRVYSADLSTVHANGSYTLDTSDGTIDRTAVGTSRANNYTIYASQLDTAKTSIITATPPSRTQLPGWLLVSHPYDPGDYIPRIVLGQRGDIGSGAIGTTAIFASCSDNPAVLEAVLSPGGGDVGRALNPTGRPHISVADGVAYIPIIEYDQFVDADNCLSRAVVASVDHEAPVPGLALPNVTPLGSGKLWGIAPTGIRPVLIDDVPIITAITYTAATGSKYQSNKLYGFAFVFAYADKDGNIVRSAPTFRTTTTPAAGPYKVTITYYPPVDSRCWLEIYHTEANGSLYYYAGRSTTGNWEDYGVDDADLIKHELLYTSGGEVMHAVNFPVTALAANNDRLFLLSSKDGRLFASAPFEPGFGPVISDELSTYLGESKAIGASQQQIVVGMSDRCVIVPAENLPTKYGQGMFYAPVTVLRSGVADGQSICNVGMSDFCVYATDGIYIVAGAQSQRISDQLWPNQHPEAGIPIGVAFDSVRQRLIATDARGKLYIYCLRTQSWTHYVPSAAETDSWHVVSVIDGKIYTVKAAASPTNSKTLLKFDWSSSAPTSNQAAVVKTPWLHLAGLAGYHRLWEIVLLLETDSDFDVTVELQYDYNDDLYKTSYTIEATSSIRRYRIIPTRQLCEAVRLSLTASPTGAATWKFCGVEMVVGVEPARMKRWSRRRE